MKRTLVSTFRIASAGRQLLSLAFAAGIALSGAARADTLPDVWISTQVRTNLLTAEHLGSSKIHVDTMDGRVTLFGTVTNETQKLKAEEIARRVEGATSVRNLLQVVSADAKLLTAVADKVIKKSVEETLKGDVTLADSRITVRSVDKGVVLLTGTASTLTDHVRALSTTARVDGVRQVASDIKSPNHLSDAEIWRDGVYDSSAAARSAAADLWTTTAVKLRLLANTETPGFDINVDTVSGVVTLFGVVDSPKTKATAEAEAKKVEGAKSVQNELQVVALSAQAAVADKDGDIQAAVQKRLAANTQLADAKLKVDVKKGMVRMTGTVASQVDRLTALIVVRTTKGVRGLLDEIKVSPTKVTTR